MPFGGSRIGSRSGLVTTASAPPPLSQSSIPSLLSRLCRDIRDRALARFHRLRSVSPDRWFLIGFGLLLLAFLFVLLVQPSAVGRGGR